MGVYTRDFVIACAASVSVRFRSKERGTRVKDHANFFFNFFWLSFHFWSGRNRKSLGVSLLRNQTETLATQANELLARWS